MQGCCTQEHKYGANILLACLDYWLKDRIMGFTGSLAGWLLLLECCKAPCAEKQSLKINRHRYKGLSCSWYLGKL